ncbi:methyltransferase domain-containing protein [Ramlibacter rhizophilus]|uniref:Methyltransferase domain-containing protein n=1 Tax=Ramlibacter rhizophilus TaxID=1781167 RepID=A0A4Z0BQQ1_9BURK|nr:methyltransferase domain-containing protein [Ramlibacter rhizophilus]TFZ01102.1 methyltransferase domain-containing protein [Ramlibacter rhizophilus]
MPDPRPPTLDPVAAARWQARAPARSPWLHEEVGRRMQERLEWIRLQPARWADWAPVRGGLQAHALVAQRYAQAPSLAVEPQPRQREAALAHFAAPWWRRWGGARTQVLDALPDASVQMLWANMALHFDPDPQALIASWHRALQVDGFLMFSCLGPDSARELRRLYAALGWPPAGPEFTDMHDWGDMLVHAGFAEPVMDMERLTLTWSDARALLAELRELGANLHPGRFASLRGRRWRERLEAGLTQGLATSDGRLALDLEIIYGHALRPQARPRVGGDAAVSLEDMRGLLRQGRPRG